MSFNFSAASFAFSARSSPVSEIFKTSAAASFMLFCSVVSSMCSLTSNIAVSSDLSSSVSTVSNSCISCSVFHKTSSSFKRSSLVSFGRSVFLMSVSLFCFISSFFNSCIVLRSEAFGLVFFKP